MKEKKHKFKEDVHLKLLPFYTGARPLEEALSNPRAIKLLWLEVLFNEEVNWSSLTHIPEIKNAYRQACVWYSNFRTLLHQVISGKHLRPEQGKVDMRYYRVFVEVLHFVSG